MTGKEKNRLRERIGRLRQLLMISLMIISGIWYVTKGRAGSDTEIKFYTSSDTSEREVRETDKGNMDIYYDDSKDTSKEGNIRISGNNDSPSDYSVGEKDMNPDDTEESENIEDVKEQSGFDQETKDDAQGSTGTSSSLVNLNTATLQELDSLPGVGPATAKNIIEYREKYGGFAAIEEIKNVKRIGDKTFEKLKDYITV